MLGSNTINAGETGGEATASQSAKAVKPTGSSLDGNQVAPKPRPSVSAISGIGISGPPSPSIVRQESAMKAMIQHRLEALPEYVAGLTSTDPAMQLSSTTEIRKLLSIESSPPIQEVCSARLEGGGIIYC